ncbi:MAG: chitobiase/beta-hexosaminidase C-terminal domain-containing protein, partial [Lachnospiraceae bacterium]|nr:chitobiase/beta-hexosaminidase C-terminal domain-containing protein [Lachnospiraceae bacterium]
MGRKSKKALARIMALLMAFALLPFDLWGTANMVIAEETSEAYTEEAASTEDDAAVTEDITDTQDEGTDDALADDVVAKEHESSDAAFTEEITDIESVEEDSAFSGEVETSEETKEVEVQEEEKPSTEIVNKVQVMYVHNFTTDGHESDDFFNISGKKQGSPISFTYVDKNNKELTLEAALKMESATSISFNAMNAGTLVLVHPTSFTKSTKVDGNKKTAVEGIIEVPLDAGTHTITKGDTTDLYYIAFITEAAEAKEKAAKPTADPVSGEIEIGGKITLSCATPDATIYYTTDGNEPKDNASKNTYSNEITIESNMVTSDNKITIKAYAEKEGYDDSDTETFEYTVVTTGKPQVNVSTDSEDIDSVKTVGDIYFVNESGKEVAAVKLKVQKVTVSEVDANVKAEAEKLKKEGGEILYYDFSLVNAENENEIVSIAEGSTGKISIKMPYSVKSGTSKRNEIIVLHNTNKVEVTKESDGFSFSADSFSPYTVVINPANAVQLSITRSAGYEEGAYAEWEAVDGADGYMAYAAPAGGKFKRIDDELIREYSDHWRVDTVGLAKGTYYIKVDAVTLETKGAETTATVIATNTTDALKVTNYDRSGFAFSSKSPLGTGSGAYNDDGTLKDGAQVIYVTAETAKTVTATVNNTTCTGLQAILAAKEKKGTSGDILDIRIIGCVTRADLDSIGSSEEGLQVKGNKAYENMNITIEGIGEDAAVKDFGFLIRNCGNVELRNFGILAFMDDGVSMDTGNCNI